MGLTFSEEQVTKIQGTSTIDRLRKEARRKIKRRHRSQKVMSDFINNLTYTCVCRNVWFLRQDFKYCPHCGVKVV